MKYFKFLFVAYILSLITYNSAFSQYLYKIPKQTIDPFKILGQRSTEFGYSNSNAPKSVKLDMEAFEISTQITFGQYKEYLKDIKKDSSHKFYLSQLPDTSMCLPETYKEYVSGNSYDDFPVVGITWEAAMNYCRWITASNNKGAIAFICRLPSESEWLDTYNYLQAASIKNDLSQNYSDWLLNAHDEDWWDLEHSFSFDYIYMASKKEPNVLKRKSVIGDSYLFKMENLADYVEIYGYQDHGYRQIGFRVIKEPIDTNVADIKGKQNLKINLQILKSWGLK
ncbi:MAG TPA: SUMF1/EgtB/PvdO family nonheme iron enzyme [Bacteroidia bacterium]|jgi:hypothetical protein|nr:SUMF1/EgtB/PvdO family nonheme iron enzyme [Bacteroidia bacterium]